MGAVCHNTYKAINCERSQNGALVETGPQEKIDYDGRKEKDFVAKAWYDKFSIEDYTILTDFPPALNYLEDLGFQFLRHNGSDETLRKKLLLQNKI